MTTDVLKVPGNYIVKAQNGSVTLDSSSTVVTGNLTILGATTTIESVNATVKDNIIVLNSGETNPYVSLGSAGLLVARGNSDSPTSAASLIYDDTTSFTLENTSFRGNWDFGSSLNNNGHIVRVAGVILPSSVNTLTFFSSVNPTAVLSVKGTVDYETNVTDDDHIPNKAYVDALLASTEFAEKVKVGETYIELTDGSVPITNPYYGVPNKIVMNLGITGTNALVLQGSSAVFDSLSLIGRTIQVTNTSTGVDLTLEPANTGVVKLEGAVRVLQTPAKGTEIGYTTIYSTSTVGGGGTGLHYVNTGASDELVSRRRSIVYSLIF